MQLPWSILFLIGVVIIEPVSRAQEPVAENPPPGIINLSPELPDGSWPDAGQNNRLSPNYTVKITVNIAPTGMRDGKKYNLVPNSENFTSSPPDAGVIWVKNGSEYQMTNTSRASKDSFLTVHCHWRPESTGGGGSGVVVDLLGTANASVVLLDTLVVWIFSSLEEVVAYNPLVPPRIAFEAVFRNEEGVLIDKCLYQSSESSPLGEGWVIEAQQPAATKVTGSVASDQATFAQLKLKFDDGKSSEALSDKLLMAAVGLVTPGGDPVAGPIDGGDGSLDNWTKANEFTFPKTGDVLKVRARVSSVGVHRLPADQLARASFEIDGIGSSTQAWVGLNPTFNGDTVSAMSSFTGLPVSSKDFGKKGLRFLFGGKLVVQNAFEVFFPKSSTNHPGSGSGVTPNWFYYWCQTSANKGNITMNYIGRGRSSFDHRNFIIKVGDDMAWMGIKAWGFPQGIDQFGWATAHEAKHCTQMTPWWGNGYNEAVDDKDGDIFKDDQELTYMATRAYNPLREATYLDEIGYTRSTLNPIRDCEDICMRSQVLGANGKYNLDILWVNSSANAEDWANPGKNSLKKY